MSEQRFLRFNVTESTPLAKVAAETDATSPESIRVDDGIATVGFHGNCPAVARSLDRLAAPSGGKIWSLAEVLAALPPVYLEM